MSAISDYEKWMRATLLATPEIETAVGERIFNSVAPPNTVFPYLIFSVAPLEDRFGQARTSIQTRLLCDVQIHSLIPFPEAVDEAIEALKENVRQLVGGNSMGDSIISIRHERPISRMIRGTKSDQHIIARGSTYRVWVSRSGSEI